MPAYPTSQVRQRVRPPRFARRGTWLVLACAGLAAGVPAHAAGCLALAGPQGGVASGSQLTMLWLGNSLTNTAPDLQDYGIGPMPTRLAAMLSRHGVQLRSEVRVRGGAEFADHAKDPKTLALLGEPRFDAVNFQGYYQGYQSAAAFQAATRELLDAMQGSRATPLFQTLWSFLGDPGSAQFPASALAVEGAAQSTPHAQAVPVMRVWEAVKRADPTLHRRLHADGTHQSAIGEHLNALTYLRFLTGRSVRATESVLPRVRQSLTPAEQKVLEEAVDQEVRSFFRPRKAC